METYNEKIKKRIMFSKDSDYYFITYNSLLILDNLKCYENKSNFCDYRKLIFILPFISEKNLLKLAIKQTPLRNEELRILEDIYINAKLREPLLKSILFSMEKKGLIILEKNKSRKSIDVRLRTNVLSENYLNSSLFNIETNNLNNFKSKYKRLNVINLESLIDKLFKKNGVMIWDI
ncbi:hypothetical protein [Shouchella patagoniensis]|uniref:hypothetical protein n=1 Tax=Shouchella patagoniensis TaxID=228576 RepID=UPI000995980A|nr:hypothetical protein [Shouchella patagoniensis]